MTTNFSMLKIMENGHAQRDVAEGHLRSESSQLAAKSAGDIEGRSFVRQTEKQFHNAFKMST